MTYNLLKGALDVSSMRQDAVSNNLANINTPEYKASRVVFNNHLTDAMDGVAMTRTNNGHISPGDSLAITEEQKNTYIQDNGNNVDIDFEMAELAANNIYYDSVVSQLNAKYQMMRNVIS